MSSSEIENAWSTYIFLPLSVSEVADSAEFLDEQHELRVSIGFGFGFLLLCDFVFKVHFLEFVRYWIYSASLLILE